MTEFVGRRAAATYLGIKPSTLANYVKEGTGPERELDLVLVGRRFQAVFTKDELDRWLDENPKIKNRLTTEDRDMFARKTKTPKPAQAKTTDPRAALVHALADAGEVIASACGTCGATVAKDDPEAEQTYRQVGTWPYPGRSAPGASTGCAPVHRWGRAPGAGAGPRRAPGPGHPGSRGCGPEDRRALGVPGAGKPRPPTRAGASPVPARPRAELAELRAAVEKRHLELTVPVPHSSGWPCGVCGRSHELADAWDQYQGRPVCAGCSQLIQRAGCEFNPLLTDLAFQRARPDPRAPPGEPVPAGARDGLVPAARSRGAARALDVRDRPPEVPLTQEERLAELLAEAEKKLAVAA
ncbi:DNA-binding protein [Micromonospora sp. BRA006-A]|nr:DNA-binding protein [Micromonospora sp. BRA006-A]